MKKKKLLRIRNTRQAVIYGIFVGIAAVMAIVCLLAAVLVKFDIPAEYVKFLWFIPAAVAGILAGGITGKHVRANGFLWGSLSASVLSVICILVLLSINSFSVEWITFLIIPVFALCGSIGGIIAANMK